MAQDFAKKRQPDKKAGPRKKSGAASRKATEASGGGSHWNWFFTGLLSGLFIAFIAYLGVPRPPPPGQGLAAAPQQATAPAAGERGNDYDFYDYLPEAEVMVDVVPVDVASRQEAANDNVQYLLQAGSFQDRADAESRRAGIILLNYEARVVPGTVSGKTWHRVQVGPFSGRNATEEARDALSSSNIDTIVLRMK